MVQVPVVRVPEQVRALELEELGGSFVCAVPRSLRFELGIVSKDPGDENREQVMINEKFPQKKNYKCSKYNCGAGYTEERRGKMRE